MKNVDIRKKEREFDMKRISVRFSGMTGEISPNNNFIMKILGQRYEIELSENPDFLIYSVNSQDYLDYHCPRIYFTPENLVPDFNICDYAIGFHYLDFDDRYIRFPLYLVSDFTAYNKDDYASDLQLAIHKHEKAEEYFKKKVEFCAFVYSNGQAAKCREDFFNKLSEYKQVNSGGGYKNNVGGPVESKLDFQAKHKFVIAFENTSTPGYTTEKIVHAFAAGAVPIYWGDPEIGRVFNTKAFINCHDYGVTAYGDNTVAFEKIINEIERLDSDDKAYLEMLSQAAFVEGYNIEEEKKKLENFLCHIFDQEPEIAYRRNRYYWGERYERKQRIGNKFYWMIRKLIPIRDDIKRLLKNIK
jgi:hypothetical protein